MQEHLNNHWPKYLAVAAFGGAALFIGISVPFGSNSSSSGKAPHIDTVSPNPGYVGVMATISGSGFTKQSDNITETRIDGQKFAPGNYIKVLGQLQQSHAFSQDGATLQIRLDLNTSRVVQECTKRTDQNKPCNVGIKVVNGYGAESNEFHYLVTNKPPPLHASYEVIPLNPANPTQNIPLRISDSTGKLTEVMRYKLTADPKNDTNIYVLIGGVTARSLDGASMDCSNIFSYTGVGVFDVTNGIPDFTNNSINGGMSSQFNFASTYNFAWCTGSSIFWNFALAPGEQRTLSLVTHANPTAPTGLQFRIIVENFIGSDYIPQNPGDRDVFISNNSGVDWLDGGAEWSNPIIIAP